VANDPDSEFVRRRFDWNLLHTYMVIASLGSITAAARTLRLQQPTVSNALKRLEEQLGTRLIDRRPGCFELTAQGSTLFQECQDICSSIGRLDQLLADTGCQLSGHLRIHTTSHVLFPPFDRTLAAFHAAHPQVTLQVEVDTSINVAQAVLAKTATVGICLVSEPHPRLQYEHLFREYFGFFCGPSHPLFGRRGLTLQDLRGTSFVSFDTDHISDALRPVARLRAQLQIPARVVATSASLEEVLRMIHAGLGVGPLPIHVAEQDVHNGQLWRLPPYAGPPAVDIYLVRNPRARLTRTEQAFLDVLAEHTGCTANTHASGQ